MGLPNMKGGLQGAELAEYNKLAGKRASRPPFERTEDGGLQINCISPSEYSKLESHERLVMTAAVWTCVQGAKGMRSTRESNGADGAIQVSPPARLFAMKGGAK